MLRKNAKKILEEYLKENKDFKMLPGKSVDNFLDEGMHKRYHSKQNVIARFQLYNGIMPNWDKN